MELFQFGLDLVGTSFGRVEIISLGSNGGVRWGWGVGWSLVLFG